MLRLIIIAFMIFSTINIHAQTKSIENEIFNYKDTVSEKISNGKDLLLEKIISGDTASAKRIINYLLEIEVKTGFAIFNKLEYQLLLFWVKDYKYFDYYFENNLQSVEELKYQLDFLDQGLFFNKLRKFSINNKFELAASVKSSEMTSYQKDFFILYLNYLIKSIEGDNYLQYQLNRYSDSFLAKYVNGKHNAFVKQNIRRVDRLSDWGFGMDVYTGYNLFTHDLNKKYGNNVQLGLGFSGSYKNLLLDFRFAIGLGTTNQNIELDEVIWKEGSAIRAYSQGLELGYKLFKTRDFDISPYIGIGGVYIEPIGKDMDDYPVLKYAKISTTFYSAGISFDYKMSGKEYYSNTNEGFWFIRFRYTYAINEEFHKFVKTGNGHYLTIGMGIAGRKMIREE